MPDLPFCACDVERRAPVVSVVGRREARNIGFYLGNTLHAEMRKDFSQTVIKVAVLDMLLKWIFHVSHRSPGICSQCVACLSG